MKYNNFNEFYEAYKKRALSPEFRKAGLETLEKLHNEILDKPIREWLDIASEISPERNGEKEWRAALEAIAKDIRPRSQAIIVRNGRAIKDIFERKSLDAWKKVVERPVDLPPETVHNIMNQKAIKELFVNVIHDAIVGFNKKFNPFAGAMAAFGLEKQIKEFLVPFMDSAVKIATDFVNNKANQPLFSEFAGRIFEIAIAQKPDILDALMDKEREEEIWRAIQLCAEDATFRKLAHEHVLEVIADMKKDAGEKTLRQWLAERQLSLPFSAPTEKELDNLQKLLAESTACAEFMFRELSHYS
ncbi:MAG: hypothetical protein N2Z22_05410 [Turneriella sp.]|nr:hypothetical protein [Leptospiraceae bacterium]MCX7632753.1 hypothetical protein [Turneriella sp.]